MRYQGRIANGTTSGGSDFISPDEGRDSVFVHISSLPRGDRRPCLNDAVSYILAYDSRGRPQASDVRFTLGSRSASLMNRTPRLGITAPIALAISFLVALGALVAVEWLEISWLALYYGMSLITYGVYSADKTAAQNEGWRTSESTLHLMSLVGGWPGALVAQVLLRHKTRKPSFLIGYWFTVTLNCIALALIVAKGVSPIKVFLGFAV